jgi:hypothetical protein
VNFTYAIRFYRIYDAGDVFDLNLLEEELARGHAVNRANFTRVKPKSISMDVPPVLIRLGQIRVEAGGQDHLMTAVARVYDVGAISICFVLEDLESPASSLQPKALLFAGQEGLEAHYAGHLAYVQEILRPVLGDLQYDPGFYEDYTIYIADRTDDALDPVVVLLGEDRAFSAQTREAVLKNSLSYGTDDLAILSWDTALLMSTEPPGDLIELIEFANVQALEFRYYDRVLTQQMGRMYDDIESADRHSQFRRLRQYHGIMTRLMETHAEISDITEKVDNLIKITEDIYYARVYGNALEVLRISQWRGSVNRRIDLIRQNYMMLSDEVNIQHSNFLEVVIILLIALEIGFLLWEEIWVMI